MATRDLDGLSAEKRALLEQRLRGAVAAPRPAVAMLTRRTGTGPVPLSPAQEQLWYFSRLAPENPVYNEVVSVRRDGPLDVDALRAAFNELVQRHAIWRTTFQLVDGEPMQVIHRAAGFALPVIDLSAHPEAEREAVGMVAQEGRRPYDLERGPLLRPLLIRFAADHHRLYLAMHHLIFDGVSLYRIALPELVTLYESSVAGRHPSLPAAPQYADYAIAERQREHGPDHRRRIDYWRGQLSGAAALQLPTDRSRPPRQRFHGAMQRVRVPAELADGLRSLSRSSGTTLFQVLATAFTVLLSRYSGQEDVVFGTVTDMRDHRELEQMVGYCLTPLVMRVDVGEDPPFIELLGRVRAGLIDALSNLVPFERLVRELRPQRDPGVNPLFGTAFVLEPRMVPVESGWSLHQMEAEVSNAIGNAKFDLLLECDERPEGHLDGRLIYDRDLFEPETATRMAGHWITLLQGIAADPTRPVSELPLLTAAQLRHQVEQAGATAAPYPRDACLHELVTAQAMRTPDAVAAVFGEQQLTFAELDARAGRLAARLAAGNPRQGLVAIYLDRSLEMLVGMLAILKSGAAYLPLDLAHPAERLSLMLHDSRAVALLTHSELLPALSDPPAAVVCVDQDADDAQTAGPLPPVTAEDLAYVLYTSGSTGRPKGVCISHRSVVNLLTSVARWPGMTERDTILATTTYGFDIAAIELWLPLVTGARIVIASREQAADGRKLVALTQRTAITILQATPAGWQMMLDAGWRGQPGLVAISTGEALSPRLARSLLDRTGRLWNMYGPTETTVWSTGEEVVRGAPISIGRPIANTRVHVLGPGCRPVPTGVAGELAIAGDGVAAGYLHRPELTAERFIEDPFVAGERMYLTGDLARQLSDGRFEHLGRLDHQVKVRGFRVEPGEIEAALTAEPDVADAVVIARGDDPALMRLIAYVVAAGEPPPAAELRRRLRVTLPAYMVPSAFVTVDALPLSANGKLDRSALPEASIDPDTSNVSTEPRTDAQRRMAAIWESILGVSRVGVNDDFFELGGHSLLALRLLVEVEREFGEQISLAVFVEGAVTVAGLAATIEATRGGAAAGRSVDAAGRNAVPIQPHGTRPMLFVALADERSLLALRHFTAPLGPDQPVLALLPDRVARRFDRSGSIEDLATPMLETVRDTQPHGPYFLAGYSLGGMFAYEMAGRLRAAGEQVAWLGLLDTCTPDVAPRRYQLRKRAVRGWKAGPRAALRKIAGVAWREITALLARLGFREPKLSDAFDHRGALMLATSYPCRGHDAPMDVFATDDTVAGADSDSLGWSDVHRGRLRVHRLGGDHLSMFDDPYVDVLSAMVTGSAQEALRATQGS